MSHAAYSASCFLDPTDPPSCRCNHLCHEGDASICTGRADEEYRRLGHDDEVIEAGNVCHVARLPSRVRGAAVGHRPLGARPSATAVDDRGNRRCCGFALGLRWNADRLDDSDGHDDRHPGRHTTGPVAPDRRLVSLSDGQGTVISWFGPDAGQPAADFQANSAREDNTYWTLYGSPLMDVDDVCTMSARANPRDNVAVGDSNSLDSQTANHACADFLSHGWQNSGPSAGQGA